MFQRPPFCHNLSFALRPPPAPARRIAAAAGSLTSTPQPPGRLHVTLFILRGLPAVDPLLIEALRRIGAAAAAAPFEVAFDRIVGTDGYVALRPSRRNAALTALHDQLVALAGAAGLAPAPAGRFNPHMSVTYRDGRRVNERIAPVGWLADELVLIDSHVGATRHELVDRWPLAGAPDPQWSLL